MDELNHYGGHFISTVYVAPGEDILDWRDYGDWRIGYGIVHPLNHCDLSGKGRMYSCVCYGHPKRTGDQRNHYFEASYADLKAMKKNLCPCLGRWISNRLMPGKIHFIRKWEEADELLRELGREVRGDKDGKKKSDSKQPEATALGHTQRH